MSPDNAPLFTSAIVIGSALGVFPIGAVSDRIDRRLVMAAAMIAGAACEIALSRQTGPGVWLIALGFLVGMTTYSLYTLAVSLANDAASPHDLIFISVGLLFIYCVAAIAAPAIASVLMRDFGPRALFLQNAAVHLAIAAFAVWRLIAEPAKPHATASRLILLGDGNVGRGRIFHADDMVAGVDMEDFAGHAARHGRQQIDRAFSNLFDRDRAPQRRSCIRSSARCSGNRRSPTPPGS